MTGWDGRRRPEQHPDPRPPPCSDGALDIDATRGRLLTAREHIDAQIRELTETRDALDGLITEAERWQPTPASPSSPHVR
ncbi:hypothetical protein [Actinoplanes sp. DH11]|uniref:hypothetical protein n=1 Tax=Actinoplanes sp. DH11 TaxID=2857011 RepID=UPI001E34A374|nr:hypothetical protein [Actinoplanes sp. DH11]